MAKGRSSKPNSAPDGKWFRHQDVKPPGEINPTSTGEMLETPYHPNVALRSSRSPLSFQPKTAMNFKTSNTFSQLDNKRVFNTDSDYFSYRHNSRILGRRHYTGDRNLHYTDVAFLHHPMDVCPGSSNPPTMISTYGTSFHGGQKITNVVRRFPKVYCNEKVGTLEGKMCASHWFKDPVAYKASTETLVGSLCPYIKHNPWKYSYQSLSKVYPN